MSRHPNQGPKPGHVAPLANVDVATAVNEHGHPLVQVLADGETDARRLRLMGQLTPNVARGLADNLRAAAEAAESDAILFDLAGHGIEDDGTPLTDEERRDRQREIAAGLISRARELRAGRHQYRQGTSDAVVEAIEDYRTEQAAEEIATELEDTEEEDTNAD